MAVTQSRFAAGMTVPAFIEQMTTNRDKFIANYELAELPGGIVEGFRQLAPLNLLVLAEDWCGDVIAGLPVVGKLAAELGEEQLSVRVLLRDQNRDLANLYLKDGLHHSIPVFVFFDQNFEQRGYLLERPRSTTEALDQAQADFLAANPDLPGADLTTEMPEATIEALIAVRREYRRQHFQTFNHALLEQLARAAAGQQTD